jgi:hypothetical protein
MENKEFIEIVMGTKSMALAAKLCRMSYRNFRKKALELGVFNPNPSGKGTNKPITDNRKIPLYEILNGEHPQYQTYKLKKRLIEEGIFEDKCSKCGWGIIPEGRDLTPCELDHIDGNPNNHSKDNLILLCPNCHSLTRTYRFRRGKFEH